MLKKDLGICIRAVDYSDTSQVLTFFCRENGKISVIAKGAKRKKSSFGGAVEILSFGELIFTDSGGELCSLREFEPIPKFVLLRNSLLTMNCAMFSAELINHFSQESHTEQEMFDLFSDFLSQLQTADSKELKLTELIFFQINLLELSGLGLILDRCTNCNKSNYLGPFLSSEANGFVCMDCQMSFVDKVRLSKEAVKALANQDAMVKSDFNVIFEIERAMVYHFSQLMHKQPKLGGYFTKMENF